MEYDDYGRSVKISKPIQEFLMQCWDPVYSCRPTAKRCEEFFIQEEESATKKNDNKGMLGKLSSKLLSKHDSI